MKREQLAPTSKAAQILRRICIGDGYCAGPHFPGNTIRKSFAKLERLKLLDHHLQPTAAGRAFTQAHYVEIMEADQ